MIPDRETIPVYRRVLIVLGLLVILIVGLTSNLDFNHRAKELVTVGEPYIDGITLWENRLTLLNDDLPDTGMIGYIADWDIPGQEGSSDLETEYRLTQYALAPLVVARGPDFDYVVGNITLKKFDQQLQEHFRLHVQHEFDYGILLLRKY